MTIGCRTVKRQLGAYVDGELTGAARLRLFRHLGECEDCSDEVRTIGRLGGMLRGVVAAEPVVVGLDGLAAGVVSRVRAEAAQTWRARLRRAVDDCRWLLVGTGSIAGSFATAVVLTVLLVFGPGPGRADSLAALMHNLGSPAGALFVVGAVDDVSGPYLVYVSGWLGQPRGQAIQQVVFSGPTGSELARALSEKVVVEGELLDIASMPAADRRDAEALMDIIRQRRSRGAVPLRGGPLSVSQVRLVTSTDVSVKGL